MRELSLEACIHSFVDRYSFLHVVGEVVNIGAKTAEGVEVVVTFYDKECDIISSDTELITPSMIEPRAVRFFDASTFIGVDKIDHWLI